MVHNDLLVPWVKKIFFLVANRIIIKMILIRQALISTLNIVGFVATGSKWFVGWVNFVYLSIFSVNYRYSMIRFSEALDKNHHNKGKKKSNCVFLVSLRSDTHTHTLYSHWGQEVQLACRCSLPVRNLLVGLLATSIDALSVIS